jgi:hypothetical protein
VGSGYLTGYFRQAADDQSRAMGDVMLVQIVFESAIKMPKRRSMKLINALPDTDVKKPGEIK